MSELSTIVQRRESRKSRPSVSAVRKRSRWFHTVATVDPIRSMRSIFTRDRELLLERVHLTRRPFVTEISSLWDYFFAERDGAAGKSRSARSLQFVRWKPHFRFTVIAIRDQSQAFDVDAAEAPHRMSWRTFSFPIDRETNRRCPTIRSLAIRMLNISCRYSRVIFYSIRINSTDDSNHWSNEFEWTRVNVRHEGGRGGSAREESRIRNNALFKWRQRETHSDRTQNGTPLRISTFTRDSKGKLPMQEDLWR